MMFTRSVRNLFAIALVVWLGVALADGPALGGAGA